VRADGARRQLGSGPAVSGRRGRKPLANADKHAAAVRIGHCLAKVQLPDHNAGVDAKVAGEVGDPVFRYAIAEATDESLNLLWRDEKPTGFAIDLVLDRGLWTHRSRILLDHVDIDGGLAVENMHQLVGERVPEAIDTVEAKRQRDHRGYVIDPQCGAIDTGARQLLDENKTNTHLSQQVGQFREILHSRGKTANVRQALPQAGLVKAAYFLGRS